MTKGELDYWHSEIATSIAAAYDQICDEKSDSHKQELEAFNQIIEAARKHWRFPK